MRYFLLLHFVLSSLWGYNQSVTKVLFLELGKTFTYKVTCEVERMTNKDDPNSPVERTKIYPAVKMTVKKIMKYNDSLYVIKLSNFFATSVNEIASKKDVYVIADNKNKKLYTRFSLKEDTKEMLLKSGLEKKITDIDTAYLNEIRYSPKEHVYPFLNIGSSQSCDSVKEARDSINERSQINDIHIAGHYFGCLEAEYQLKAPYFYPVKVFSNALDFDQKRYYTEIHVNEELGIIKFYTDASLIFRGSSIQYDLLDTKKQPYNDDVIE